MSASNMELTAEIYLVHEWIDKRCQFRPLPGEHCCSRELTSQGAKFRLPKSDSVSPNGDLLSITKLRMPKFSFSISALTPGCNAVVAVVVLRDKRRSQTKQNDPNPWQLSEKRERFHCAMLSCTLSLELSVKLFLILGQGTRLTLHAKPTEGNELVSLCQALIFNKVQGWC